MANEQSASKGSYPMENIKEVHKHDVLCGRGNFVNNHAGNEYFRDLVKYHKVAYVACDKGEKGKFSRLIVHEIRSLNPPGRFLKQDNATNLWFDIGDKKAIDKTRQALREGAPELLKELTEPIQEDADRVVSSEALASFASLANEYKESIQAVLKEGVNHGSHDKVTNTDFQPTQVESNPFLHHGSAGALGRTEVTSILLKDPEKDAAPLRLSSGAAAAIVSQIPASELEPNPVRFSHTPMRRRPGLFGAPGGSSLASQSSDSQGQNASDTNASVREVHLPEATNRRESSILKKSNSEKSLSFEEIVGRRDSGESLPFEEITGGGACRGPRSSVCSNMSFSMNDLSAEGHISDLFQESLVLGDNGTYSSSSHSNEKHLAPGQNHSSTSDLSLGLSQLMDFSLSDLNGGR
uniref:DUF6824 domain-containing protein n=1 Tax=Ditylum brightwellii TaxID=49249 RepID=A0A7S2EFM5_9STRA|mmetsp:Transcript_28505/g.42332  ORF Transcript_28505/g.42332 Transcript_28505/m.42332 type:complete len:409 (+) Transcript_28505:120-1346(+)